MKNDIIEIGDLMTLKDYLLLIIVLIIIVCTILRRNIRSGGRSKVPELGTFLIQAVGIIIMILIEIFMK